MRPHPALPWRHAPLGLALLGAAACSAPAQPVTDAGPAAQRLQAVIGAARCTRDADCRTIALGARACGGPERYVAWSLRDSRADAIARAAEALTAATAPALPGGAMSTCQFIPDPGAYCQRAAASEAAGRCTLRSASPGPGQGPTELPTR